MQLLPLTTNSRVDSTTMRKGTEKEVVEGIRDSTDYETKEIPTFIPPGFFEALRPLSLPTEHIASSTLTPVEPSPVRPIEPQNIHSPSLDCSEDSKYFIVLHSNAVINLPSKDLTVTSRFVPKEQDPTFQVMIDNWSESKVATAERTRLPLSFEILNWGLRGRNVDTRLIRDSSLARNATSDHLCSMDVLQSFKSTTASPCISFSLLLQTRPFERISQPFRRQKTRKHQLLTRPHSFDVPRLSFTLLLGLCYQDESDAEVCRGSGAEI